MKRSKTKPLPCPFCGHEYKGEYVGAGIGSGNRFECPYCGALGPFPTGGKRRETPVEAWNLRVEKVLVTRKPRAKRKDVVLPLLLVLLLSSCGRVGVATLDATSPFFTETWYFVSEARARGLETEPLVAGVRIEFGSPEASESARCVRSFLSGRVIVVDPHIWNQSDEWIRKLLIAHELGHCALNQGHRERASIMRSFPLLSADFQRDEASLLDELFERGIE